MRIDAFCLLTWVVTTQCFYHLAPSGLVLHRFVHILTQTSSPLPFSAPTHDTRASLAQVRLAAFLAVLLLQRLAADKSDDSQWCFDVGLAVCVSVFAAETAKELDRCNTITYAPMTMRRHFLLCLIPAKFGSPTDMCHAKYVLGCVLCQGPLEEQVQAI